MWHFGFFMTEHVPEMLFDGHELEFFITRFTAMSNPGTFTDEELGTCAREYTGQERLRESFAHCWTTDARTAPFSPSATSPCPCWPSAPRTPTPRPRRR